MFHKESTIENNSSWARGEDLLSISHDIVILLFCIFLGKKRGGWGGGGVKHFPPFIFGPFGVVCNFPLNFETNQFPLLCGKMSKYPKSITFSVKSNGIF